MGKNRQPFPEERTSSKHLISLDDVRGGLDDPSVPNPEEALIERQEVESGLLDPDPDPRPSGLPFGIAEVERWAHRLPKREVDYMRLRLHGITQEAIADLFGCTQAAIHYRLSAAIRRIRWLSTVPELRLEDLHRDLSRLTLEQRLALWAAYETTSQTASAPLLEEWTGKPWSQGHVRHVLMRAWSRLKAFRASEAQERASMFERLSQADPTPEGRRRAEEVASRAYPPGRYEPYFEFFSSLIDDQRWNVLHEVTLPQYRRLSDARIMASDEEVVSHHRKYGKGRR